MSDLTYRTEGFFMRFYPETKDGEQAWNEMAAQNDGVATVLAIHGPAVIGQLKAAGYSVAKAKKPAAINFAEFDELFPG